MRVNREYYIVLFVMDQYGWFVLLTSISMEVLDAYFEAGLRDLNWKSIDIVAYVAFLTLYFENYVTR